MYTLLVDNPWLYHHTPQTQVVITFCPHSGFVGLPHWWSSSRLITRNLLCLLLLVNLCINAVYRYHRVCVLPASLCLCSSHWFACNKGCHISEALIPLSCSPVFYFCFLQLPHIHTYTQRGTLSLLDASFLEVFALLFNVSLICSPS